MKSINSIITDVALKYVGQEEILGNLGFKNQLFQDKLVACGFKPKDSWCALFGELVWKEAYQLYHPEFVKTIDTLFSKVALETLNSFKGAHIVSVDLVPEVGALVVWQNIKEGIGQWTGHLGIVKSVYPEHFITIEGNTNDKGGREGYIVAERSRKNNSDIKITNGLKVKGFIHPKIF